MVDTAGFEDAQITQAVLLSDLKEANMSEVNYVFIFINGQRFNASQRNFLQWAKSQFASRKLNIVLMVTHLCWFKPEKRQAIIEDLKANELIIPFLNDARTNIMELTCLPRADIIEEVYQVVRPQIFRSMNDILAILETDKDKFNWIVQSWYTVK
jgi:hypothetical protein